MTPQADTSLHDDLTFMRALAEAGRNAPLTSGPYFLTAGLVFGLASFVAWAVATGHTLLPPQAQVWVWLAAMVVYLPVIWFLNRAQLGRPGSVVMVNRAIGMMWSGLGSGIGIMFLAGMVLAWRCGTPVVWAMFPSLILAVYGAGWSATAVIAGQSWLRGVAAGAFAGALAVAAMIDSPVLLLLYGLLILLLVALPGWVLLRREGRAA
ncbi:hypothetical protein HLH26_04960 [Gluconacetobacter sp. 1b LMG 1731]|uniref:Transmembrane protein n=1 Tax=Gluconacetobacter dulcium TaxID=2729096 RepID=A0A7W4PG62_9PROT|nr:hypothetical protein [Gluconacetobacter dulcium]MBB2163893.1 hypothetical protein [Gluconacetobacter dulcium]MBB2193219.1 hypothetical protein [Gluconacetobacter dulcium]MBB2196837.1 hypothetical protein [Gluconacetobacter dulcium]